MGTVEVFTSDRMLTIENGTIVNGTIDSGGHLILTKKDGSTVDAGNVAQEATVQADIDSSSIDVAVTGTGVPADPYKISATVKNIPASAVNGLTKTGLLAGTYRGAGPASVLIDGDGSVTNDVEWLVPYVPWGSRRVTLVWTGTKYAIIGQIQNEIISNGHRVQKLSLGTNWYTYNEQRADSNWADGPYATQLPSGLVVLSGLIIYTAGVPANASVVVSGLPVGMRPEKSKLHFVNNSDVARAIAINPDGTITASNSWGSNTFISLDGIAFWPAGIGTWTPITTWGGNFEAYVNEAYEAPAYYKDPYGFVWFRGMIRIKVASPAANSVITAMPVSHQPPSTDGGERHMRTAGWDAFACISATSDGLKWKTGSPGAVGQWITLEGITYPTADAYSLNDWRPINSYANGWGRYGGTSFPTPAFTRREDGLVTGKGLIGSGTLTVARGFALEREFWPNQGRIILDTVAADARARMDISGVLEDNFSSGRFRGGASMINGSNIWWSLDSVKWVTSP